VALLGTETDDVEIPGIGHLGSIASVGLSQDVDAFNGMSRLTKRNRRREANSSPDRGPESNSGLVPPGHGAPSYFVAEQAGYYRPDFAGAWRGRPPTRPLGLRQLTDGGVGGEETDDGPLGTEVR
jgi:hypothetical protein